MAYRGQAAIFKESITITKSSNGSNVPFLIENTSNTASSSASITAKVAGDSADNPFFVATVTGTQSWAWGIDNSDSDKFKIAYAANLDSNIAMDITTAGVPTFYGNLNAAKITADTYVENTTHAVSASYTVLDTDGYDTILVTTGSVTRTITLPTAADNSGRVITIKKVDSGTGEVTIDGEGAETIDGATTLSISGEDGFYTIICDATEWHVIGSSSSASSGSGEVNYIDAWNAEDSIAGWNTYDDGASATPVDGTAGTSSNITFSKQSTEVLRGSSSFKIAKGAADAQGEGVSYDFTIKGQDTNKKLKIQFDFKTDEDAAYANDDLAVYIYDVTNATLITPVDTGIISGQNIFQTSFNSTDSLSYRIIFHVTSTNASAWDAYIDNVIVGPGMTSQGAAIGPWTSFTPALDSATASSTNGWYRRVGDSVEVQFGFTMNGGSISGNVSFDLNANLGLSVDNAKFSTNFYENQIGIGYWRDNGTKWASVAPYANDTDDLIEFTLLHGALDNLDSSDFVSGDTLTAKFTVPVAEWVGKGIVPMLAEDNLSEWTDYTPSNTAGLGTITSRLQYRRVGDTLEISGDFDCGTVSATEAQIGLPAGLTMGGSATATVHVGMLERDNAVTTRYILRGVAGETYMTVYGSGTANHLTATGENGTIFSNSDRLSVQASIPIAEWAGSQNSLVGYSLYNPDEQTGLVDSRGVKGHTNGSAITAGYVGEELTGSGTTSTLASGTWTQVDSLALTAGVWMVSCAGRQNNGSGATYAYLSTSATPGGGSNPGDFQNGRYAVGVGGTETGWHIGPILVNVSSTTTYYFHAYVTTNSGSSSAAFGMRAVRIA